MKILNQSITNPIDETYYNCMKKTSYCSYNAKYLKVRERPIFRFENEVIKKKAIANQSNKFELPSIFGNESIGPSHSRNIQVKRFENEQKRKREEEELVISRKIFPDDIIYQIKYAIDCFQETDSDLEIFKMYDKINLLEIVKLADEEKSICFEYFKRNINLQHFYSYLFYKKNMENTDTFFDEFIKYFENASVFSIEKLYLRNCNIDILDKSYFYSTRYKNIKELYLSHNKLTNIDFVVPQNIFKRTFPITLTKIDISHNNILYLPHELDNLQMLNDINLKYNKLLLLKKNKSDFKKFIQDNQEYTEHISKLNEAFRLNKILFVDTVLKGKRLKTVLLPYIDEKILTDLEAEKTKLPYSKQYNLPTPTTTNTNKQPIGFAFYPQSTTTSSNNDFGFGQFGGNKQKKNFKTRKLFKIKKIKLSKMHKKHKY